MISDPSMMKGWEDVFGTESCEEVTEELRSQNLDHSWKKNQDLQIMNKVAAVEKHPVTGDTIWFNHLMVRDTLVSRGPDSHMQSLAHARLGIQDSVKMYFSLMCRFSIGLCSTRKTIRSGDVWGN